jgi:probable phosphoglycerate mutase
VLERIDAASADVLMFAHGHILRVVGARWIEQQVAVGGRLALGAGAYGVLGFERETRVLDSWNLRP